MKSRSLICRSLSLGAVALISSSAAAAEEAPQGWVVGIERAFGVAYAAEEPAEGGDAVTGTSIALGSPVLVGASLPRLGFDYLYPGGLSAGSGVGYSTVSSGGDDNGSFTSLLTLAPRVGFLSMLAPQFAIWPRGGLTITRVASELDFAGETLNSSDTDVALTVEVPFVYMPFPRVALSLAPAFDRTLTSSSSDSNFPGDEEGNTLTALGIFAGLAVVF